MQSTPPVETPPGDPAAPSEAPTVTAVAPPDANAEAAAAPPAEPGAATAAEPAKDLSPAATGARLAELFPALFVGPDGRGEWKAIKLRIHADIQARAPGEFSKRTLGIFFSRYTTTTPYLKALAAPGAQRFDLDGQPAGEIAEEHRKAAEEEVARRQAIAAERRAAFKRDARPPRAATPQTPAARPPRAQESGEGPRGGPHIGEPGRRPPRAEQRPPRREGADARAAGPRPARPPRPSRPSDMRPPSARPERMLRQAPAHDDAPSTALPVDPAQRERALLLRSFESSPLSKANFCVLKRISEADLDAALAQAREERAARRV
jgi:ProP effector